MTVSKKIPGHISLNWSKVASKFFRFTNYHIRVEALKMRVNRGIRLGFEIPVN